MTVPPRNGELLLADWISGDDTGVSSKAIWRHMTGLPPGRWGARSDYPLDPDDFGRCHRLLSLAPAWRARIGEMGQYGPEWAALTAHWGELEELYTQEAPHGTAPRTYKRMRELQGRRPPFSTFLQGVGDAS